MSDDLISRKAAIEAVGYYSLHSGDKLLFADKPLKNLPSAQPEQRWVPVTERLPELGEKVLVSTKNTVFTQVFKCIYGTPDRWGWEHHTIKKVTAWMPSPEPWKGENDE